MAKKNRRIYDPSINSIMPKKMGNFEPGKDALGQNTVKSSDAVHSNLISRANGDDGNYARLLASNFPWDEALREDEVSTGSLYNDSRLTPSELISRGYVLYDRSPDKIDAEARQVLASRKTGLKTYLLSSKEGNIHEIWVQKYSDGQSQMGNIATPFIQPPRKTKTAVKKAVRKPPKNITKIAWNRAIELGIVDGMIDCGFDMYKEAGGEPGGIWWKEAIEDEDTGEVKYYLVKQKGVEIAEDVGSKKVKAVVAKKILAKKIVKKAAVGDEKEDDKGTGASKSSGIPIKTIDLTKSDWKKSIDEYLKECKENSFDPKKMEIKIIEWMGKDI